MLRLALRNLFQSRTRLLMSTGGMALALLLVLALDAIFAGSAAQVSAYIDNSGADVWVAQAGVRNMHMAASTLPDGATQGVAAVDGVRSVTPIYYLTGVVNAGGGDHLAYVIGLPARSPAGGPWKMATGRSRPGPGETVIDSSVAASAGIRVGDEVKILKRPFRVAGLSEGTASIVNSIAFISAEDFVALRRTARPSYLLVRVGAGHSPPVVASEIQRAVPGVTALTRAAFSTEEKRVIQGMSTDLIGIMNTIGLLIGLAVMALSVYTATLARRAEYGVLKALGARARDLYVTVLAQAAAGLALALVLSVALVELLAATVPLVKTNLELLLTPESVLKVTLMAVVIGLLAAAVPVRQIAALDPAAVFRRRL